MSLYDRYKLDNSTYISQYVGSVVPELAQFSQTMRNRYNEARDVDDTLVEAMSNLQHLNFDADTQYANELKQKFMNGILERAERDDYENMGRRTRRDAMQFSRQYQPLVQRQQDYSAILQRVQEDEQIYSPEKKQQIMRYIAKINSTPVNENGEFERNPDGTIKLGAIQDWSYAKDVDIDKIVMDALAKKAATKSQTPFKADGSGLMISTITEVLTPEEIAEITNTILSTNPEIQAMIERDVTLSTMDYTPEQFTEVAEQLGGTSLYNSLMKKLGSEAEIIKMMQGNPHFEGMTIDDLKVSQLERLRRQYVEAGRPAQAADRDFVRNVVRNELRAPHIKLAQDLFRVNNQSIQARKDVKAAAKATAEAAAGGLAGLPLILGDNFTGAPDVIAMQNNAAEVRTELAKVEGTLRNAIAANLGVPLPSPESSKAEVEQFNRVTSAVMKNPVQRASILTALQNSGKAKEAANLEKVWDRYDSITTEYLKSGESLKQLQSFIDTDSIYNQFVKDAKAEGMQNIPTREEFKESLFTDPLKTSSTTIFGFDPKGLVFGLPGAVLKGTRVYQGGRRGTSTILSNLRNIVSSGPMLAGGVAAGLAASGSVPASEAWLKARDTYNRTLQEKAEEQGRTIQSKYPVYKPLTPGDIRITDQLKDGLIRGEIIAEDMKGRPFQEVLKEAYGKRVKEKDLRNPNSDYNTWLANNVDFLPSTESTTLGEGIGVINFLGGRSLPIKIKNVNRSYWDGIRASSYAALQGSEDNAATRLEMQKIEVAEALANSAITKWDLATAPPTSTSRPMVLNDQLGWAVDIKEYGIGEIKEKTYRPMLYNPRTKKYEHVAKPVTSWEAALAMFGKQMLKERIQ